MLGSSAWRAIAPTVPFNWPSAGCTCGVPPTSSTLLPGRRSRPSCWPAWPASMRSRLRYAAIPPNTDGWCDAHEVGRSSRHCVISCTINYHASLSRPISRRPCATRNGIGRGSWPSLMMDVSRWTPTRSNASSGQLPSHAGTPCSQVRRRSPSLGHRDDADSDSKAKWRGADGVADRRARAYDHWPNESERDEDAATLALEGDYAKRNTRFGCINQVRASRT